MKKAMVLLSVLVLLFVLWARRDESARPVAEPVPPSAAAPTQAPSSRAAVSARPGLSSAAPGELDQIDSGATATATATEGQLADDQLGPILTQASTVALGWVQAARRPPASTPARQWRAQLAARMVPGADRQLDGLDPLDVEITRVTGRARILTASVDRADVPVQVPTDAGPLVVHVAWTPSGVLVSRVDGLTPTQP